MNSFSEILKKQRTYFFSGATQPVSNRLHSLQQLRNLINENEQQFFDAVYADFKKSNFEMYATEIALLYTEIDHTLKNLNRWAKPKHVSDSIFNFPSTNMIYNQPYGVSLIIGPWNYPVQLLLLPLVGALAAGNCAVLKPSELTPHTSECLKNIIPKYFPEELVTVVTGGADVSTQLLELQFDYIFFTGSTRVGRIVMQAAAKNLTPVTLELGGKSPAIVHHSADLKTAAKRIAWGKFLNAGQTCVAPDYILVHKDVELEFLGHLKESIIRLYGQNPKESEDYTRIVNSDHLNRLSSILSSAHIFHGGEIDIKENYIAPTVLHPADWNDPSMEDEIFGPVLPVITWWNADELIDKLQHMPSPLALYVFSKDQEFSDSIIERVPFGGGAVNDAVAHLGNYSLPFGGIGPSGLGNYHGKKSYHTFSHQKSIMKKPSGVEIPLRYPPYNGKLAWLKKLIN